MSPEQTGRMNRAVDHRTDLYSLGVTLLSSCSPGACPSQASDPLELVHCAHRARARRRRRAVARACPQLVSRHRPQAAGQGAPRTATRARAGSRRDLEQLPRRSCAPSGDVERLRARPQRRIRRAVDPAEALRPRRRGRGPARRVRAARAAAAPSCCSSPATRASARARSSTRSTSRSSRAGRVRRRQVRPAQPRRSRTPRSSRPSRA